MFYSSTIQSCCLLFLVTVYWLLNNTYLINGHSISGSIAEGHIAQGNATSQLNDVFLSKSIFVLEKLSEELKHQHHQQEDKQILLDQVEFSESNNLEALNQYDSEIDKWKQQQDSFYNDYNRIIGTNSSSSISNQYLASDFLILFDDLWRIKNQSVISLINLDYFNSRKPTHKRQSQSRPIKLNTNSFGVPLSQQNRTKISGPLSNLIEPLKTNTRPTSATTEQPLKPQVNSWLPTFKVQPLQLKPFLLLPPVKISGQVKINSPSSGNSLSSNWNNFTRQINNWFWQTQDQAAATNVAETNISEDLAESTGSGAQVKTGDASIVRLRRQTSETIHGDEAKPATLPLNNGRVRCIEPDTNTINQCVHKEAAIDTTLNHSFPGTLMAIEENCRHISFLLANCWPQQLNQLRVSLASWNETLVQTTDFPLPSGQSGQTLNGIQRPASCGVAPLSSPLVLDRINWMWLNLCMDRKFREDYVDHLTCLSMWSQERAQVVCHHEYKRMHSQLEFSDPNNAANQSNNRQHVSETTDQQQATAPQMASNTSEIDRELGSKTLCCVFDLFLRCVHKQAYKDCGRAGAQFVVNFMSRIGTDDMKHLCNNELSLAQQFTQQVASPPSSMQQQQQHPLNAASQATTTTTTKLGKPPGSSSGGGGGGSRRQSSMEKSPFIEGSYYCLDPRILNLLGYKHGANPINSALRPSGGKNRNKNFNHDPSYFGSDSVVADSGNAASQISSLESKLMALMATTASILLTLV